MENPRKKLYSSLVASADPDVKKHFSQWSADEFDKKLSEDKEFQKDLFLDLRDIGMAKDEATFAKQYFGQSPSTPAAPAANAAPVAKPTEATKEPSTYGALDVTDYGPIGAIKKGVSGLVSAAKQFIGLKSEDAKYEEAQKKSQAGSVSGFAGGKDLSFIGQYEAAADEINKKRKSKEYALKPIPRRTRDGLEFLPPRGLTPQEENDLKKSEQNYQKVLKDSESFFADVISKSVEEAQTDKSAYKKDKYGIKVPNPEWVINKARKIAMSGGAAKGGYAENYLTSGLDAALRKYEESEERNQEIRKRNKGLTPEEEISSDFLKGVEPISTYQDRYKQAVKNVEKIAKEEYRPKVEAVTNEYKSAIETYKQNVASDPSIKQAVADYDAQNIARLQEGVSKGALTVEQANAMLTGKEAMDARNAYINKMVDEKHGKPLNEAYDKYLSNVSTLNNRYNARLRRQDAEQKKIFELQYKRILDVAKKNYDVPQHLINKYEKLYKEADEIVAKRRGLKRAKADVNASIWENFVSSTLKGLGEGIQSTAFTLGLEDVATFGDLLAKNFETSDLTINSWNDIGFGREELTKFANSAGSILGRMGPGLAGSAAVAAASGGTGLGFLPSLFLTSVPSAAFETADIMGSIEQQVLAQGGDIAAAKKASERALKSQIMQFPLYTFDALPFFPKFLKFAGKGKYAALNIAKRAGAGFGINVLTETMQEVPQNLVEEIILEGKDPTFKELIERSTWEKWQNTSASVASLGLLMGAAPQIVDSSKDAIAKRAAAGYFANNILGQASHPALQAQNQTQFLTQLADEKGERFAAQMVNVLFQKGNIDKIKAEALANKLANFQNFKQTTLGKSDNPIVRQAGFMLFDKYMEAKNSKNEQAQESALAALNDYARTGNAELVMLRMPDGSFKVYNYDDLNSLMDDEDFQQASRESNEKYGAVFEITPLVQTQEGLQNPKLQQIIQRFDDIRKAAPEAAKTEAEDTTEVEPIDDAKILEGQKRSGFEVPKLFDIIPIEAAVVVDAVRSREPGVTPDELSGASNAIYQIHKMYEKMRSSTTRNLTLEQIDNITDELEQAITDLENQKTRLAIGDEQMDSLQQQDTESNQTIDTVTAPAEQAPQVAPVAAPTVEAEAPAAPQAAPEAAQAEAPAPAKPKAKVNVFTDEDVIDSFSQKESDIYDRLLFDGDEDLANQMIQDKRNELVKKEVELLDVGRISEKVRQSFARAGIDVELLSADEFVRKLKEAGESASRTTEGVFDDNRGKIFINKDALKLGWGTTVVWHEAIHPIMNIIHNSNKALYDKIHKGILANAKANPRGGMQSVINDVERVYTKEKGYTDADRKDEIIVEALARLSAGTMSFSELQPTLRQQFIDLINRIGRILGLSKTEVSDMKAIKDLAKKITETIKEGRDLSEIVGAENIGKYKRTGPMTARMAASLSRETQDKVVAGEAVGTRKPTAKKSPDLAYNKDLLIGLEATKANPALYKFNAMLVASYDIMYPVLPSTIKTYLNGIYKTLNKYQNEADTLRDEIDALKKEIVNITVKQEKLKKTEAAKLTTRIIAGEVKRGGYGRLITDLKKKIDRLEQLTQKDGLLSKERERVRKEIENYAKEKMTMQMADRIYKEFIGITQSNLEALVNLFPARLREVAKLWYDGANLIAQGFAKSYKTSIEQAAAVLAVFSPQKDWFMNISLAERLMNIYNNMMDYKFDDAMASKYLKRAGEPELTIDEKTGEEKWTGGAVPLLDEDGEHVEIDGVLQFKNWDNEKAKARIDDAAKTLKSLRGKSLRELLDAGQLDKAARFVRMYSEVYDSPNFSFYTPSGERGYESRSEKGTLRKIAWGGYNTIEKALKIMEATEKNKMDVIHNELGEMHKVRSFYNNIADPLSKDGHVTMDTHAIAAILWKALSGASFEVTQNFGGAGTKSEASIGSNGLYPVFAEAYREAANNLGYLPREIQSITWEAVRMLFKAKWKGNKENVKKIGNIWAKFRNGELTIKQAREQIWNLATAGTRGTTEEAIRNGEGVGSPDWAEILDSGLDPERVRKANDAVRLSMAGGVRYDGERGVGRPGDATGAAGVVPGPTEGGKPGGLELKPQPSLGERQAAPSFAELDEILDMSPVKSRAAREKLIDQYGKETVDRMIEISRNFTKIINGLEEQGVVEKDCP